MNQTDEQTLVERLRAAAKEIASEGHNGWGNTCTDAADTIERLLAERSDAVEANIRDRAQMGTALREARTAAYAAGQADRDAQVREAEERAFNAGYQARYEHDVDGAPYGNDAAFAAYLTRQPAAGARTEEQKP